MKTDLIAQALQITNLPEPVIVRDLAEQESADSDDARKNIREIVTQGMEHIPQVMALIEESLSPRTIEAVSLYLRTMTEINRELHQMAEKEKPPGPNTVNNTAIFNGNLEDVIRTLRKI